VAASHQACFYHRVGGDGLVRVRGGASGIRVLWCKCLTVRSLTANSMSIFSFPEESGVAYQLPTP
jgi:hypothetical protein